MNSEKWLKLFLCIAILGAILKLVTMTPSSPTSLKSSPTPFHTIVKSTKDVKEGREGKEGKEGKEVKEEKCNYTKEAAVKSIKEEKDFAVKKEKRCNERCTGGDDSVGCKSCTDLLPVMDPMYNMREMSKQIILLEDHLFQSEKRCRDCICKHFLTIEALAEEAITLDKDHKYPELGEIPTKVRAITKKYVANKKDPEQNIRTGQELRELRKSFMQRSFNHF